LKSFSYVKILVVLRRDHIEKSTNWYDRSRGTLNKYAVSLF
jgi:hypothetical protein